MRVATLGALQAALPGAVLALALGLMTLPGEFVFDDVHAVVENDRVASLQSIPGYFTENYWGEFTNGGLYRPLTLTLFTLQHALFGGESATGYHFVNALLYAACTALVGMIAFRLGAAQSIASAVGLVFAACPIHVEAYAPVVGLSELGAGLMALVLLYTQLGAGFSQRFGVAQEDPAPVRRAVGAGVLLLVALFFKESALAILVPVIAGHIVARQKARRLAAESAGSETSWLRQHLPTYVALMLACAVWGGLRAHALEGPTDEIGVLNNVLSERTGAARVAGGLEVSARYCGKLMLPWPLSADYSYPALVPTESLTAPLALTGGALWLLLGVATLVLLLRGRAAAVACCLFGAALLPVSNVLFPIGTIFAERLLYMPSVGACLALALAATSLRKPNPRVVAAALVLIAGVGAVFSLLRIPQWRTELALAESIVVAQKLSAKGHEKFGWELFQDSLREDFTGDAQQQKRRASRHLERSIVLHEEHNNAYLNLGIVYGDLGKHWKMYDLATKFLEREPNSLDGHALLATAHLKLDQPKNAISTAAIGIDLLPQHPRLHRLHQIRGRAHFQMRNYEAAARDLQIAVAANAADVSTFLLYLPALVHSGNRATAIRAIDAALATAPAASHYPLMRREFPALLNNRGLLLAEAGEYERALADYTRALGFLPGFSKARQNRVESLLRLGRVGEAEADVQLLRQSLGAADVDKWYGEVRHRIPLPTD
ncbi:MAG: tetratricopeptide repeat protein [Planctomycetota bacterium]